MAKCDKCGFSKCQCPCDNCHQVGDHDLSCYKLDDELEGVPGSVDPDHSNLGPIARGLLEGKSPLVAMAEELNRVQHHGPLTPEQQDKVQACINNLQEGIRRFTDAGNAFGLAAIAMQRAGEELDRINKSLWDLYEGK